MRNPVVDVERPAINRDEGSTAAFSKAQAGQILDAPPPDTLASLLDRAVDLPSAPIPRNHRQPPAAHQIVLRPVTWADLATARPPS
jgi:hypothetical protein